MSEYLNKIGLVKYNNATYQQINLTLYYSVRDPQLVSSDPRINFFNYPWKSDDHWSYNYYGLGWYYNGKDLIAYTTTITSSSLSCYHPITSSRVASSFVYNVIPILLFILSSISSNLLTSKLFEEPRQFYYLKTFDDKIIKIHFDDDYRAYYTTEVDGNLLSTYTYTVEDENYPLLNNKNLVLNWVPQDISPYEASEDMHSSVSTIVTGYWVEGEPVNGILFSLPKLGLGSIKDNYSNELQFEVLSPNVRNQPIYLLSSNLAEGLFNNIPGTDYITGICTTKMHFLDDYYVYMRGMFKGNIEIKNGILQNEIAGPSTIIKEVSVKNLQGTFRNITPLPDEIKYGLDHYYAWGWLYGIDNIKYQNTWYKNEISGTLTCNNNNIDQINVVLYRYAGNISTSIITNNGTEDIVNIITGVLYKNLNESEKISGYMEGVIEPYSIKMKGVVVGRYSKVSNDTLRPIILSGVLYNKSVIGLELRTILDIKYANTLGRKGLTYPDPLHGLRLNFATKNYNPFDKPYMLLTWKIIEYKVSPEEVNYLTIIPTNDMMDLNTYIVDNKYIKQNFESKIHKTNKELNALTTNSTERYHVYWLKEETLGDFVIKCTSGILPLNIDVNNTIPFNKVVDALKYIKHMCGLSNLKLKNYATSLLRDSENNIVSITTSYILNSSDLEIK